MSFDHHCWELEILPLTVTLSWCQMQLQSVHVAQCIDQNTWIKLVILNWQKNCTSQNSWLIWSDLILLLHQGQQDNFQIEDCSAELLLKYESLLQVLLEKLTYWNQQRGLVLKKEENWKRTLNYGLPLQEVFSFAMI